jgi:replicative superfamily II helicase
LDNLSNDQRVEVLRACLLVYKLSNGRAIPREFQLQVVLQSLTSRDCVVSSGTGSGKTLIMIILLLLRPMEAVILVVPLKRLQHSQLEAFTSFGILTVIVNEDTPDDPNLWKVHLLRHSLVN